MQGDGRDGKVVEGDGAAADGQLPPPPLTPPRDWFLAAIEVDGSVGACLDAVLQELARKQGFIGALKAALGGKDPRGLDAVSELGVRVKALEKTLRFRLGMLKPERPGAWFRSPAATTTGPFATALLDEPVFGLYDAADLERVRSGLLAAWNERRASDLPFRDVTPSLWRTLLTLNAEWEKICALPLGTDSAFAKAGVRLDKLPDGLPKELESRALRAFLINVRGEVRATRERLDAAYTELVGASNKLWEAQRKTLREAASAASAAAGPKTGPRTGPDRGPGGERSFRGDSGDNDRQRAANPTAESLREEFRKRRMAQPRRPLLTPADMEALRVMGFQSLPEAETLRQRYIALAKRLHPDRGGDDTAFKQLSGAYARLSERVVTQK
jgi:hypothetical protein